MRKTYDRTPGVIGPTARNLAGFGYRGVRLQKTQCFGMFGVIR